MPKFDEQNCHPFQFEVLHITKHEMTMSCNIQMSILLNLLFRNLVLMTLFVVLQTLTYLCIVLTDKMLHCTVQWYHELNVCAEGMVHLNVLSGIISGILIFGQKFGIRS